MCEEIQKFVIPTSVKSVMSYTCIYQKPCDRMPNAKPEVPEYQFLPLFEKSYMEHSLSFLHSFSVCSWLFNVFVPAKVDVQMTSTCMYVKVKKKNEVCNKVQLVLLRLSAFEDVFYPQVTTLESVARILHRYVLDDSSIVPPQPVLV